MSTVLHFLDAWGWGAIRVQRFAQSELNMGIQPVVLCKRRGTHGQEESPNPWIPDKDKVSVEYYKPNRQLSYLLPTLHDRIGLRKVFKEYKCDFVHAHNVFCAYYSHRLGLPTLFDDWEYYEYFDYHPPKTRITGASSAGSAFLAHLRRTRAKGIVRKLLQKLSIIVTNDLVESRYRELGAKRIWSVPNVPLSYEREYAFAANVKKRDRVTTCYVGSITRDEGTALRNTSGVRILWSEHDIGDLWYWKAKTMFLILKLSESLGSAISTCFIGNRCLCISTFCRTRHFLHP